MTNAQDVKLVDELRQAKNAASLLKLAMSKAVMVTIYRYGDFNFTVEDKDAPEGAWRYVIYAKANYNAFRVVELADWHMEKRIWQTEIGSSVYQYASDRKSPKVLAGLIQSIWDQFNHYGTQIHLYRMDVSEQFHK